MLVAGLRARLALFASFMLVISALIASYAPIATAGDTRQIPLATTTSLAGAMFDPADGTDTTEFPAQEDEDATPASFDGTIDRSLSRGTGNGASATSARKAKSNPELKTSFEGLNFYQQRYSRRGNQFSVEPPDQALCVGNGYVLEAVNDVLNVFDTTGASALPDNTSTNTVGGFARNVNHAVDLNSFYGYPAAINRSTNVRGQFVTDPSCYFDAATNRFFVVVLTLETRANGSFTHVNHLDIGVSQSANPTGSWNIYRTDVTNDGSNPDPSNACPCLGDYPHIGADANGFYVTTNSYPWGGNGFAGAQVYAYSKAQLAAGAANVTMSHIDTFGKVAAASDAGATQPGFTVWPAQSPGLTSFNVDAGGTEFFLSSNAADEATRPVAGTGGNYVGNQIVVWALTNTSSLNGVPALTLASKLLDVNRYAIPPKARQTGSGTPPGINAPQGYCLNDETTVTVAGTGCWKLLVTATAHARGAEVISSVDSNDTRMQQVTYANGKIWGALGTAVTVGGANRAGIAYYVVKPDMTAGFAAKIALQGTVGLATTDLIYPAIGVTASGRGVIAMTLTGDADYPSAAYASIDASAGMGDVHVIAAGAAPADGFTSYTQQVGGNPPRTRWGDYGAAAVDGNSIWVATEYIAQACDYTDWGGPFFAGGSGDNLLGTCGGASHGPGKRAALGNWSTRISKLTP